MFWAGNCLLLLNLSFVGKWLVSLFRDHLLLIIFESVDFKGNIFLLVELGKEAIQILIMIGVIGRWGASFI